LFVKTRSNLKSVPGTKLQYLAMRVKLLDQNNSRGF